MKVLSSDGLTKLIQLIKSGFVSKTDIVQTSEVQLANVATSGSYNDLSDKPTIPTTPSQVGALPDTTKYGSRLSYSDNNLQLLDQDGNALGSSIEIKASGGCSNNLFDHKWSDHILNDISWLRADTFSWQDGTVYSDAYNHLVADMVGISPVWETVGSYQVAVYNCADGHKVCTPDQETNVANIYNESGVAWYYILDTTNTRFRLPRTKWGFTGVRDGVGNYIAESLPKPTLIMRTDSSSSTDTDLDAIYGNDGYTATTPINTPGPDEYMNRTYTNGNMAYMDIFHSSYQDGAPVQQRATQMYLYFYVGNYTKSATEQTAGLNTELFNGKMDVSLSNMNASASAKETIVGWGIPDYTAGVSISSGYVAVTNGMVLIVRGGGGSYVSLYVDGIRVDGNYSNTTNEGGCMFAFVKKGSTVTWNTGNISDTPTFFPCVGG